MELGLALQAVRQACQGDPARALLWLSCLRWSRPVKEIDSRLQLFVDEALHREATASTGRMHTLLTPEEIEERLDGLPPAVHRNHEDVSADPDVARTRLVPAGPLIITPYHNASSSVHPVAWTVLGLALMGHRYRSENEASHGLFPRSALADLCARHAAAGGPMPLTVDPADVRRPLSLLAPAFIDDQGRLHDVADLAGRTVDQQVLAWLCRGTLGHHDLAAEGLEFLSNCWAAHACKLHDLARFEHAQIAQGVDGLPNEARNPTSRFAALPTSIGYIVACGANLTPAIWGRERYFENVDVPETHALAMAVLRHRQLSDDEKVRALEHLRLLGHDVVVAHRHHGQDAGEKRSQPYWCLPLMDAAWDGLGGCINALLEWGADPDVEVRLNLGSDSAASPRQMAYAATHGGNHALLQLIQAHEARLAASQALIDLDRRSSP